MLRRLFITNYALIERAEISFDSGFTAITGETGSGKSILIGALGLILGDRADMKSLRNDSTKCVVEGVFSTGKIELHPFFQEHDLDYDEDITLRREISPGGKSRAFINDTPVQLNILKELGTKLVDIHSQHENSILGDKVFQFDIVDAFAKNQSLLKTWSLLFDEWRKVVQELNETTSLETALRKDLDYFKFQFEELSKLQLDKINEKELEEELQTLTHAESIRSALDVVSSLLDEPEQGIISRNGQIKSALSKISSHHSVLSALLVRIESAKIELTDILNEITSFAENIVPDESRINEINTSLSALHQLKKKHGVQDVSELLEISHQLTEKISTAENFDTRIEQLKKLISTKEQELKKHAALITDARVKAARLVEKESKNYFRKLGLEHARLEISITEAIDFTVHGKDEISMLFAANKGSSLQPVQSVASGGEISRVMLALKAAISEHRQLPTLILDEIDQGISGETARQTGIVMKEMSSNIQVISITHLPQIAGKSDHHFRVSKTAGRNETFTHIEPLNEEDRILELAGMLSGKEISGAALENARELLKN